MTGRRDPSLSGAIEQLRASIEKARTAPPFRKLELTLCALDDVLPVIERLGGFKPGHSGSLPSTCWACRWRDLTGREPAPMAIKERLYDKA